MTEEPLETSRLEAWLIRVSAFVRKDVIEIVRQPQLLIGVVLGPFLLLLAFGASLGDLAPELDTVIVTPRSSPLFDMFEQFRFNPRGRFEIVEVTPDRDGALDRLRDGDVEIVLVLPSDPQQTIRRGEPAEVILYHNFIDPLEGRAITTATELSVGELNEQVVAALVREAQTTSVTGTSRLDSALSAVRLLRIALATGDVPRARAALDQLREDVDELQALLGPAVAAASQSDDDAVQPLADLDQALTTLEDIAGAADLSAVSESELTSLEEDLEDANEQLALFSSLSPEVVISPLSSRVQRVVGEEIELADFYSPAVLALLGQHLVITMVALSTVQERLYGTTELFSVSPLSAIERLTGRYVGALSLALPATMLMVVLLILGLGVPMLGSWLVLIFIIITLLTASIGIGFLIAQVSATTTQTVQYAMGILLASVFFSGFILSLQFFRGVGRIVALLLPATYGIQALRDVMLRGDGLRVVPLLVLPLVALGLFAVNWLLLRRH